MKPSIKSLLFAICTLSLFACAGAAEPDETSTNDELRVTGISSITVHQSQGYGPRLPPGMCQLGGRWTVDFATKKLTGNACVDEHTKELDEILTDADFDRVKAAVAGLRTVRQPISCPTDLPVRSVTVERGDVQTEYMEELMACSRTRKAVKGQTIRALVDLMHELSVNAATATAQVEPPEAH